MRYMNRSQIVEKGFKGMNRGLHILLIGAVAVALGCSEDAKQGTETTPVSETAAPAEPTAPDLEAMAQATVDGAEDKSLVGTPAEVNADLVKRGRGVYAGNCTACHNPNPNLDGALGPALAGSSLELITMRVLHVQYPPGYTPKRDTAIMLPLAYLEPELPALAAFLNTKIE
jgi:mono/diheme cytochrome c family protein